MIDSSIRTLSEISLALNPRSLNQFGLEEALKEFVEIQNNSNNGVTIILKSNLGNTRLEQFVELNIFRLVQEISKNAIKHSGCKKIEMKLNLTNSFLHIEVSDNGTGFNFKEKINQKQSLGLKSVNLRVEAIGGVLKLNSSKLGSHFKIRIPRNNLSLNQL